MSESMEEPVFVKCEPVWSSDTEETSNFFHRSAFPGCKENPECVSEVIPLEQELKAELAEPRSTQENMFEPSADIKEGMFIEQLELVPNIIEENNVESAVLTMHSGESTLEVHEIKRERQRTVSQKSTLETHIPAGERPHRCERCDKTFTYKSALLKHLVVHSGEKPFCCKHCNIAFSRKSTLQAHMRIHTGDRPFQCDQCDSAFKRRFDLQNHLLIHSGQRPYFCEQCTKSFTQKGALQIHMRQHTGERPYRCQQCNMSFTEKGVLQRHMLRHSGERPYCCSQCNQTFTRKFLLRKHLETHSGVSS